MLLAVAEDMEEARRRNASADELAMLPVPYDSKRLPQRMGVELKIDGIGILDANGHLQSLEGAPFAAAMHLAHELGSLRAMFGTEMVLHGEFFEPGGFPETVGAFRSGKSTGGCVVLWDAVTLKAWHGYEQSPPLWQRRQLLGNAFLAARPRMVTLSELIEATPADAEQVELALNTALEEGHEGLVVKDMDSPYRRGRSPYWMKVKPVETVDVPIQSARVEDGRLKSIVVTFEGKPLVVGSGISETLRFQPDEFPAGRMVEVRRVGKHSSFVRFRDDRMRPNR